MTSIRDETCPYAGRQAMLRTTATDLFQRQVYEALSITAIQGGMRSLTHARRIDSGKTGMRSMPYGNMPAPSASTSIVEMPAHRPRLIYGILFIVTSVVLWGTASWMAGTIIWV
ncbi:hypothetical protein MPPM_2265 [Methylorubrum populi]|uniref:Uncharacterized protein n=1 Tax=Methylorubrum populi TaxID=223967 RepID=A0A160PH44_9HYPH|nr:hypothetical protein MPPM_2265 [Methylorubrum populi]